MKIKKFKARNFTEALRLVKQELSEHAVILASEEKKGLRPYVEVTAAIDYELHHPYSASVSSNSFTERSSGMENRSSAEAGVNGCGSYGSQHPSMMSIQRGHPYQLGSDHRRDVFQTLHEETAYTDDKKHCISLPLKKRVILNFLRERSIREEFALRLCETAQELDDIPFLLSADIKVADHDILRAACTRQQDSPAQAKALMFIGPTGVGKTTTIAKLAACAMKNGKRVGIISLDTYRIGAIEQVRIYAKIMGIPLSVASNGKEFKNSLSGFAGTRDIVFIDTSGRNPNDEEYINELLENVRIGFPLELHLLMSANYDDEFMTETFRYYRKLPIDYLSITKVDESVRFGPLYNLLLIYQKPVAFLTTGQKVPDDIESASVDRMVNLILKKRCYEC